MYTNATHDAAFEKDVLERIGKSWDTRVAVRKERLDLTDYYKTSLPDYPISLVPFWNDPDFVKVDQELKLRLLAAAWVAYNEKAIYLEDEIVLPACGHLLKGRLPGASDPLVKQVLVQVQVDEQFHILMCLDVCNLARKRHQLYEFIAPAPSLGVELNHRLTETETGAPTQLLRLAYAAVAEMSINAYLNQVASDMTIQPINRINTDMHRRDESVHSIAFHEIVASVYKQLEPPQQVCFRDHLANALNIFTTPDVSFWAAILEHMEIPGRERIVARLNEMGSGRRLSRDYTVLRSLFQKVGIVEDFGFVLG